MSIKNPKRYSNKTTKIAIKTFFSTKFMSKDLFQRLTKNLKWLSSFKYSFILEYLQGTRFLYNILFKIKIEKFFLD